MKYKLLVCVALLVLMAVCLSGCNQGYAADDRSKIHVGIVFDIGGKDDAVSTGNVVCGNEFVHGELVKILRKPA